MNVLAHECNNTDATKKGGTTERRKGIPVTFKPSSKEPKATAFCLSIPVVRCA